MQLTRIEEVNYEYDEDDDVEEVFSKLEKNIDSFHKNSFEVFEIKSLVKDFLMVGVGLAGIAYVLRSISLL